MGGLREVLKADLPSLFPSVHRGFDQSTGGLASKLQKSTLSILLLQAGRCLANPVGDGFFGMMPFWVADDPGSLLGEQVVEGVETVEDERSRLRIVTEEESKRLPFQ